MVTELGQILAHPVKLLSMVLAVLVQFPACDWDTVQVSDEMNKGIALAEEAGVAVAAEALTGALERLDALDGRDSREAVLDALFRRFCIGK